jgi:hypothetical protein
VPAGQAYPVRIPTATAELVGRGMWRVSKVCILDSLNATMDFQWIFYDDGPRLVPTNENAADVLGR